MANILTEVILTAKEELDIALNKASNVIPQLIGDIDKKLEETKKLVDGAGAASKQEVENVKSSLEEIKNKSISVINVKKIYNSVSDLSLALQNLLNTDNKPIRLYFEGSSSSYKFKNKVKLRDNVTIEGDGVTTVLESLNDGVFYTDTGKRFMNIRDLQIIGKNIEDENEIGICILGGEGGSAKLVIENVLVSKCGNHGIYLENCWDSSIDNVNCSSNKGHGLVSINCYSTGIKKYVGWRNAKNGLYLENPCGSLITGTVQENEQEGVVAISSLGCTYQIYLEQNGYLGTLDKNKAQFRMGQVPSGATPSGNNINLYCNGGKDTEMPSKYGFYGEYCENNVIGGTYYSHIDTDVYLTSNTKNNIYTCNDKSRASNTPNALINNGDNKLSVLSSGRLLLNSLSSTSETNIKHVTFTKPLTKIPKITATINAGLTTEMLSVRIANKTLEGFDFIVTDGTQFRGGINVNFIIVEG